MAPLSDYELAILATDVLYNNSLDVVNEDGKKTVRPVIYDKDRIPQGEKTNVVPLNPDSTVDHSKAYEVEITSSGGTPQGKELILVEPHNRKLENKYETYN
ncbi:hypothetical protein [Sporocytophaga myxococcoides]|uniref:hypothetical protein n=1 Tax=Sporocytophaga myxococcoides TaxID=153721 RepID=UPI00048FEAB3|nr:hypothetical protein [Sporocytophaga myxococcoides]